MKILVLLCLLVQIVVAQSSIKSSSLLTCMDNSSFTASHFEVVYYPDNKTAIFDVTAISNIDANVTAQIDLIAYGLNILSKNVSFCSLKVGAICPFTTGRLSLDSSYTLDSSITGDIPGVAFTIPDLDARVRVQLLDSTSDKLLACVEAVLSNGKTVQTKYASWPIAAIAGLGVVSSGVISVIGHSNTAAHIASNSMSLFIYFQSLAITSMLAVAKVPPIAAAWSQNFMWSLGIVRVGFVQNIANWYVQSTGGENPTDILGSSYLSVSVQKRTTEMMNAIFFSQKRNNFLTSFAKRGITLVGQDASYSDSLDNTLYTTDEDDADLAAKILVLRGIQRVAYLAGIEITSFFMTGIIFLMFFAFVLIVALTLFKAIIEILVRSKIMNEGKFNEYRQHWSHIVKGTLYRLLVLAFPQIVVLCLWQLTQRDSSGTIAVAVILFVVFMALLIQAAVRVIIMGRKSVRQFKNPAYLLFGDGIFLNKFGFIYVQYRADCYYFISASLFYIFLKSLFVAVLQSRGSIQSIIVFIIELIYCVAVCWIRPYMDKRTNIFNITISIINTINALFFVFFSYLFNQPEVVASVMAIVYFVLNACFALFLLCFTIITCVLALIYKNPDTRYQPMKDDRVSFLPRFDTKNGSGAAGDQGGKQDELELMALGATAMKGHEVGKNYGYEEDSMYDVDSVAPRGTSYAPDGAEHADSVTGSHSSSDPAAKRESYYLESVEPTQPTSTIVGNPNNAFSGFNNYASSGNSSSAFSTASRIPQGYPQNSYNQKFQQQPPQGSSKSQNNGNENFQNYY